MSEDRDFLLLGAYRDGELSPGEVLEMERRLAADPDLRALAERLDDLSGSIHEALAAPPAPPTLRASIVQKIGLEEQAPRRRLLPEAWRSLAAMLMVGLLGGGVIGGGATYLASGADATGDAVLAGHLRGLAAPQPFDVASSNRHVVKPWFNGRTTIAPEAPDLAGDGFPLAGGRIDVVDGKTVPTLVYRHGPHLISVTVVPSPSGLSTREERRGGSTIERWSVGDLGYWAISDVAPDALRQFGEIYRKRTAPPSPHSRGDGGREADG